MTPSRDPLLFGGWRDASHRGGRLAATLIALVLLVAVVVISGPAEAYAVTRDGIITRAQRWVDLRVPYSQRALFEGHRTDCSGFVSMAWGLPGPGRTTRDLAAVSTTITRDQLQPGDIMLKPGTHVAIFAGWHNAERTIWRSLEQSNSQDGAVSRLIPYPFWGETGYVPRRFNGLGDDFLDVLEPVYGRCRYETAVRASWTAFPVPTQSRDVVLATGEQWPDALGGASLAGVLRAPVLLTRQNALPTSVRDEIVRLRATRVIILGGPGAVATDVAQAVDAIAGVQQVERIGGVDRFETAAAIATRTAGERRRSGLTTPTPVYLATGADFPDALAVSPIAYARARPVLLTGLSAVPTQTIEALRTLAVTDVTILGGTGVVDDSVMVQLAIEVPGVRMTRIHGADRYATALAVAAHGSSLGLRWRGLGLAAGTSFADALAGGVAQGRLGSLLLLTPPRSVNEAVESAVRTRRTDIVRARVYGGFGAVGELPRSRKGHALRNTR
ncbi:MAG: cell wall-binding repeat-containing protein [Actinobacteria bacterium]|nr:cell wall-binding repeat-containing protein [Actinomycetota bacterium]